MAEKDYIEHVIDDVSFFDCVNNMGHKEALEWAASHGFRVLERWEWSKLYDESEGFRKSTKRKWYWAANACPDDPFNSWMFNGFNGAAEMGHNGKIGGVRCVIGNG